MIAQQIADALEAAHEQGIIHRDLKPANIMTGGFGEVLVLDWGLAVVTGPEGTAEAQVGGGTPAYMAPEMLRPPFRVGPCSDIYLLGGILFRILTGTPPHAGKTANEALRAVADNVIRNPEGERAQQLDPSGELLAIALRAMETQPADRYQTVAELQQAIRGYRSHHESLQLSIHAHAAHAAAEATLLGKP